MQEEGEETIRVLTVRGKQYRFPADRVATLAQLKQRLSELAGIPFEQQEIIINGTLCRDPTTPLSLFGSNPIYILARKPTDEAKFVPNPMPKSMIVKGECKAPKTQGCEQCLHKQRPAERFLSREEEGAYRRELEGSYSSEKMRQLRNVIAIDEQLAIRALRACCNNVTQAFEFVELEQRGQNYLDYQLDQQPLHDPAYEQGYLQSYVIQQHLFRRIARSRLDYTLFVASMKEKSPLIYDLFVRNRIFMEKLLFDENHCSHGSEAPLRSLPPFGIGAKTSMPSFRVKVFEQQKEGFVAKLQMTGVARQQAQWRLRLAGNNWPLAIEMLLEGNTDEYSVDLDQLSPTYREHLLVMFLRSPAWTPLKGRLRMMAPQSAFVWVQRRIIKHFPAVLSLSNKMWQIYPLLLDVPYTSIERVNLIGTRPSVFLRPRQKKEIEEIDRYYRGLVDREVVETLSVLGVEGGLAERATRAGRNLAFWACRLAKLGTIPTIIQPWMPTEDNELKQIDYSMRGYFKPLLNDPKEFHLEVAAMAQKNPDFYRTFLKYAGIYEAYRDFAGHVQRGPSADEMQRRNMKQMLQQMGDLEAFFAYGVKIQMLQSYQ